MRRKLWTLAEYIIRATTEHYKDKVRKECLWRRFARTEK